VACIGERRNAYSILVGEPGRQRPLPSTPKSFRPRCRWQDNIKIYLQEIGWKGMDWIHLTLDRAKWWAVVYTMMNIAL
jgi:hypothetical protein